MNRLALIITSIVFLAAPASATAFAGVGAEGVAPAQHARSHHAKKNTKGQEACPPVWHRNKQGDEINEEAEHTSCERKRAQEATKNKETEGMDKREREESTPAARAKRLAARVKEEKQQCETELATDVSKIHATHPPLPDGELGGEEIHPLGEACASLGVSLPAPWGRGE